MDRQFKKIAKRHQYAARASTAFMYAILVSIAMNFFWTPGKIYASGITGLAQVVSTVAGRYFGVTVSVALMLFSLNVPLFLLAWKSIGHRFTVFTILSVGLASIMIKVLHPITLSTDPIICAIFGGAVNGYGTGLALKNGISTGGLDILGITILRRTGRSIGSINIAFNIFIVVAAGFLYGWPYAFYSTIGLIVNARVMDMTYTRQQKMQVMIITDRPKSVIDSVQNNIRRGITIVHGAEGAYNHNEKTILFTIISRYEMPELEMAMKVADPKAFVSITDTIKILGHFYEPTL
ncbi:YitT family protein [Pediococcus argentinicus]|uniref:DUF2179 domain-containing protein n=1 Tax=Pediococcus argentinicus TaxID=480391 RepID=A0A0R2NQF3_9LACO|nr:YitT family protein [Pediococcus argentinicus]KRO26253.1 hypothetical protein IV88_GL000038 [Pediococcus argentinicus]NKZ21555.1 YitT family protein [Pediococcus argentinicus]GEP18646.1 membrane protein [Pediococcus argentinicus]